MNGPSAARPNWKTFSRDLWEEIYEDDIFNGSAALAYYFLLSLFPAMIFLLSLLPYLPVPDLYESIAGIFSRALPGDAYLMFDDTIREITTEQKGGLLSVGALLTLWAASTGMYSVMQQLNITYDVKEARPFWKARLVAVLLTVGFGALIIGSFALIMAGSLLHNWLSRKLGFSDGLILAFSALRWGIIGLALFCGLAVTYYFGPNVKQNFRFISPGSLLGVVLLAAASLGFRYYVDNFGSYNATYGGIGAVIVLMLWLNIMGLVILLGSEVNALLEHYSPKGKSKGEREERPGGKIPGIIHREKPEKEEERYAG